MQHITDSPEKTKAPPKTFLCYRGGSTGSSAGIEIARCVYDYLKDEKAFSPVFFAELNHYDFRADLEQIFRSVRQVVFVLTVNFFDGFFEPSPDPNAVLPREEDSITLNEMKMAFSHSCELFAVFSGEFSWSRVDSVILGKLKSYFGKENIERLMHISNPYVWRQTENPREEFLRVFNLNSITNVQRFLRELKPETERLFETELTSYAVNNNTGSIRSYLREFIAREPDETAYPAFFLLQVMLRQVKEYEEMRGVFNKFGRRFRQYRSYSHLWVLYLIECGEDFDSEEALNQAWKDCEEFPDNAGFVHLFADVYATACERATPEEREALAAKWGARAEEKIELALTLDPDYAKYYCTKGRILALKKQYREAEKYIGTAINKEKSERQDYEIRLMNYQYHRIMVQIEKRLDRLRGEEES